MIRYSVKNLDNIWRTATTNIHSKESEIKYAKELCEMFDHFRSKGNILDYTVEVIDRPIKITTN